ncbi:hypothetical protein C922_03759 [Plasmodium inui San Antonio 1]|uniref:Uncharacterized protein n=1 Tax=Plasmodium inui San Antonio 1 TaxID=1237626 RepID=W7AKC4_9APIC|nr:hypothetical protein C922_03759 [Plasmodium inui San Antonio 1]EUD65776.1 hypothetical protein C922_03759 [Plasmodium inui San Antonio 1]
MEIKLNVVFNEVLLMRTDEHGIENHDKVFVDKRQNVLCVQCMNKIFFNKSPLYKKYALFKSVNEIYSIKNCQDFRYHFSFFLLDHTLFLSNTFSYLEGTSERSVDHNRSNGENSDTCGDWQLRRNFHTVGRSNGGEDRGDNSNAQDGGNKNCYADAANNELITLAINACKEFLSTCSEDLCNIFKDAIYTCVLVRLKKFSTNEKKYFYIFKLLKKLMDGVAIIHTTLKNESAVIEEFIKLFVQNYAIPDDLKKEKGWSPLGAPSICPNRGSSSDGGTANGDGTRGDVSNGHCCNGDLCKGDCCSGDRRDGDGNRGHDEVLLLTLQIIYKLWGDNSLWQINKELLKNFFSNLIKHFKCTNKNTHLCNYYVEFIYIITKNYNEISYFFNTIIFGTPKKLPRKGRKNRELPFVPRARCSTSCSNARGRCGSRDSSQYRSQYRSTSNTCSGSGISWGSQSNTLRDHLCSNQLCGKNDGHFEPFQTDTPEHIYKRGKNDPNENGLEESQNETKQSHQKSGNILQRKGSEEKYNEKYIKEAQVELKNVNPARVYGGEIWLKTSCRGRGNNTSVDECDEGAQHFARGSPYNSDSFYHATPSEEENFNAFFMKEKEENKSRFNSSQGINTLVRCTEYGQEFTDMNHYEGGTNSKESAAYYCDSFARGRSADEDRVSDERAARKVEKHLSKLRYYHGMNSGTHSGSSIPVLNYCDSGSTTGDGLAWAETGKGLKMLEELEQFEECAPFDKFPQLEEIPLLEELPVLEAGGGLQLMEQFVGGGLSAEGGAEGFPGIYRRGKGKHEEMKPSGGRSNPSIFSKTSNTDSDRDNEEDTLCAEERYEADSGKCNNNTPVKIPKSRENIQNFITLCNNLQETLLNNFCKDTQMKCLEIFYKFCSIDKAIVNIILSNTSLIEWVFDFLSNTKYECLREKTLKFLVTFFIHNSLFAHTHAHYMIDVLIDIILKYVNKRYTAYNQISDDYSNFFNFLKALNMLINGSHSSLKIFHVFKIVNIVPFLVLVSSPDTVPTSVKEIVAFFEDLIFGKEEIIHKESLKVKQCDVEKRSNDQMLSLTNKEVSSTCCMKEQPYVLDRFTQQRRSTGVAFVDEIETRHSLSYTHIRNRNKENPIFGNNLKGENPSDAAPPEGERNQKEESNNQMNKVYITNISALFRVLKTALKIMKMVNMNKTDVYVELIFNEQNDYLYNVSVAVMKLLFSLIYILNKNEKFLKNLKIIDEQGDTNNGSDLQVLTFVKLTLYLAIDLHTFFKETLREGNHPFHKDIIYFIKFLYLSCIFIFENICIRKKLFRNVSTSLFFSSFFTPFFHLLSGVLNHVEEISPSHIRESPNATNCEEVALSRHNDECVANDEEESGALNFEMYKRKMRKVLMRSKPFTLFFQYVSGKNYDPDCHRILEMLLQEEDGTPKERENLRDILIEIISKHDFYFTKVLLFNFNDNGGIIETVIYILYLCATHDRKFIEKKLAVTREDNYVEKIFSFNDYEVNINPLFLFMSLSYSYYFITKDKIASVFKCIQKEMHKINLSAWLDIKKIKNIYLVFDCIFSLKISNATYSNYFSFIIHVIKLELSLYTSIHSGKVDLRDQRDQRDPKDQRFYLSISKNGDLVQKIFENIEMNTIENNLAIYVYYLIIKLRKYSADHYKTMSLYKMMNAVIRHMHTVVNTEDEIEDIFCFYFIFFENLEAYAQKDIFNIITLLQKLTYYVKASIANYFGEANRRAKGKAKKGANAKEGDDDVLLHDLKFENFFFYFIINLILFCRKYKQIQNINVLSSSIALIQLLLYCIQFSNNYFVSLSFFILSLLILPLPEIPQKSSFLLMTVSTSFDKCADEIIPSDDKLAARIDCSAGREKYVIRRSLFFPLVNSADVMLRVSSLSLLLCLLLTNDVLLVEDEALGFFITLINSSYLSEWNETINNLLLAIFNVLLLSSTLNLQTKSFCFNFIYSFRPFFLRFILRLNRDQKIIIHKLFFLLITVKIKPLWFDLKVYGERILKIILNVVTKKDLDLVTFHCISSLAYEAFLSKGYKTRGPCQSGANKNVIDNLEEYLETYKKNVKDNDRDDIFHTSFRKFKCKHIDDDVVLAILNATRLLLYR